MNGVSSTVAKKYATAFLNLFIDEFSCEDIHRVCQAGKTFKRNHTLLFFLGCPMIAADVKKQALDEMLEIYSLGRPSFEKLVTLLIQDNRTYIVGHVLSEICSIYAKRKKLAYVSITSAHELTQQDLAIVERFLANLTEVSIIYDYKIDKSLIAGIRVQSDTFLWQYSVSNRLEQIELSLTR